MKTLTIMVGLPRSGKSTYVEEYKGNRPVVSADQMRQLVYGQRFWAPGEAMMWATRDIMFKALLEQGCDIIVDETNINEKYRSKMIKLGIQHGYKIIAEVFKPDVELCLLRAMKTDQKDLMPIIDKMAADFTMPTFEEGFDIINIL